MVTQVDRSLLADLFKSMVRTMKNIGRNGVIEQRWQFFIWKYKYLALICCLFQ